MRPVVTRHPDGSWELLEPISFVFLGYEITVPAGFVCDLASIPRVFRSIIGKTELGLAGPIFHDLLYQAAGRLKDRKFSRREADLLFRVVMAAQDVPFLRRWAAWAAVRVGAWAAWRA